MKVYDNYEISGCHRLDKKGRPHPNGRCIKTCEDSQAQFWTIYGHIDGEGVEAIGDFSTREAAEQVYTRITGLPFIASYQADARLRMMHAGPKLLEALQLLVIDTCTIHPIEFKRRLELAQAAIAEATASFPPEPRKPIVIEVSGGVVQDVLNVPPGYEYEIKDYDNIEADEETAAGRPA